MKKAVFVLKKTLKIILWIIASFVLLFITIAIIIQIPAVQTKIISYATSFVSNKTHTKVEIKKISLSFPTAVVIDGLFLEDTKKDTLIFAGKIKVSIALTALLHNEIHVRSFSLDDVTLNMNRTASDSLFNYNFLITAFSDTVKEKSTAEPEKSAPWTFRVDKVSLNNIRFRYNDAYGGTDIAVKLEELKLKPDKIDIANLIFAVDEVQIDQLSTSVLITKSGISSNDTTTGKLPVITVANLQISNTLFTFGDSVGKQTIRALINTLKLKDASVDLPKQYITLNNLFLSKSNAEFKRSNNVLSDTAVAENNTTPQSDWTVSVKNIDLIDNSLAYIVADEPPVTNSFDANHLIYKHVSLAATDLYYSPAKIKASIKKLTAVDDNSFSIKKFEMEFSMDQHSIIAKNLIAVTTNSAIDADLRISYSSLASLEDSLPLMIINADMKNVIIKNSDIIYFAPQLIKQPFFKNATIVTSVSGVIRGPLNNLYGKNLLVKTGNNTMLKTDFSVVGLPDFNTAYFNFPNLIINSGKTDITMFAGPSIPATIELPETIILQIVFKGRLKAFTSTLDLKSSFGSAKIYATIDQNENFKSNATLINFDLGRLLKDQEMFGPVSLTAETTGHGLDKKTIKATIKADVSQAFLNKYTYHNLTVDGNIRGMEFEGKINLDDENAAFNFDGLVNLNPGEEQYKFNFNLLGADLKKLNFTEDDIRIGMIASADLKGGSINAMNGKAGIANITIVHEGKQYVLDSFLGASINEPRKSELKVSSALIDLQYNGTMSPAALPKELSQFINNYFPFSDSTALEKKGELQNFNFAIQLHSHPILSEVFFPELKEFEPGLITGSFDSEKNELIFNAAMFKIVYGTTEIRNLALEVNSDENTLNYKLSGTSVSNSLIEFENLLIDGNLADNAINVSISSIDENLNKKLLVRSQIVKNGANYKLMLDPDNFYLMNDRWDVAADNYIEFGKQGFLIHHLFLNKTESQINIASVHDQFNDDLSIEFKNFKLDDLSGIIEKDTSLVKGNVDGAVLLKRVNNAYGIIADAEISNLIVREVPIGNLSIKAENPTAEKFDLDISLSGAENNLTAKGYFIPNGGDNSVNITADIQSLSMKTLEAFSMGAVTEASGNLTGNLLVEGNASEPDVTGELIFNNAFIRPAALNNLLELKHETVQLKKDGIYFHSFTVLDTEQHVATIDGTIKMSHFKNFVFALNVNMKDFLLFNTTVKDNDVFFGRMIIDSKIEINGPMTLPVVNAKIKMKKGSNFTFVVPEEELTTDKGEDVVEFEDSLRLNTILGRGVKKEKQTSGFTGFDVFSVIEIDKQATLRLLMDPASTDSLVVRGEAALSFTMDRSGKMSLTGAYNINDGNYLITLGSVIKRKFAINPGSTLVWNGELLEAEISVNAIYSVRAAPIDLVFDQVSALDETEKNKYKQRYPFLVLLKLRGAILHPVISFEIQLPPEDKGILGGAVNAKLNLLNEDPSALNKQVFALLVLGRFIQENPLQSETYGASSIVRTTVGKFLSAQLNQLSSKVLTGVELNFDVQSYDDYQSGQAQGRTQIDLGIKKQLFNERLTVQVGGSVDVEGEQAKQNSASNITGDVTVEYKLTKDGRYRLNGFRHNQYEGAIEGKLVETGAGVSYVRDFDTWKELFRKPIEPASDSLKKKKKNNNDAINPE